MKIEQFVFADGSSYNPFSFSPQLIFVFGSRELIEKNGIIMELTRLYPDATFSGCSTAGEIVNQSVRDNTLVITGIQFSNTFVRSSVVQLEQAGFSSMEAGRQLVSRLPAEGLKHIFVLSDGLAVNGTDLVRGIQESIAEEVTLTGGLAGDGAHFSRTVIIEPDGSIASGSVAAIGFYGALEIGFGSRGGWDSFGLDRLVTRSSENILYEIDGQPALDLYKSFLGDKATSLPASGLLFPLSMRDSEDRAPVVRTILGINEEEKSLTFAGDIPEGSFVRLMKANNDRLINGAEEAAHAASDGLRSKPEFALLVSCVGRKLVLKQMVEEEVECVSDVLDAPVMTGFYSYGELAPFSRNSQCELHNQTMTITTFSE
ncbi:FIST signal transduction protein [Dyadobacter sandarakinus]|uniref:FIST C-terminal domain-containing protein n=1 Tax=Dyadobacter sandarakinus TaxID=2747268 RepID=A0ABX7IBD6_9BACT|nr:FIST N-terminal domain-containing protein [Dyadobacter sandarakinus]QRR03290.1 FIST C-terminal domain-containing protein [Dyadobacter sandarakinus]